MDDLSRRGHPPPGHLWLFSGCTNSGLQWTRTCQDELGSREDPGEVRKGLPDSGSCEDQGSEAAGGGPDKVSLHPGRQLLRNKRTPANFSE